MSRTTATLLRTCGQRLLAALLPLLALLFVLAPAHAQSNNATFVSQSVPSTMVADQTYDEPVRNFVCEAGLLVPVLGKRISS